MVDPDGFIQYYIRRRYANNSLTLTVGPAQAVKPVKNSSWSKATAGAELNELYYY